MINVPEIEALRQRRAPLEMPGEAAGWTGHA